MAAKYTDTSIAHTLESLEGTFGKIPEVIQEHLKYFDYDDESDQFICISCGVEIKRIVDNNKIITANFESHIMSEEHKKHTNGSQEIREALSETFCGKIPHLISNNIFVLGMDEINYYCLICEKIIPNSAYLAIMEENFSYHLLSWGHIDSLERYRANLKLLQEVCGQMPSVISSNSEYLSQKGTNYVCKICNKLLIVDPKDLSKTRESFESHFISKEHLRNSKGSKAFAQIPELKMFFETVPNLILKNIKHFSAIGGNFYCSLCCEIIKCNLKDPFETEHNFKRHILSDEHEQTLLCRRDENNEVFIRLKELFDVFPEKVVVGLKYLVLLDDLICCSACEEFIVESNDLSTVILERITSHLESSMHENNVEDKTEHSLLVMKTLETVFGSIPESIYLNIEHIHNTGDDFACSLCDQSIDCSGGVESIRLNFENHFESEEHQEELKHLQNLAQALNSDLEYLYGSVPQFIIENWNLIGYDESKTNFYCFLCDDVIKVVYGSKKGPLTLQNFRNHMFSLSHLSQLKDKANKEFNVSEKLALIFGSIPTVVLNNLEHLRKHEEDLLCDLCNVLIKLDNPIMACNHHLKNPRHKKKVQDYDESKAEVKKRLDAVFKTWSIPGFLLKNLDQLSLSGDNFFCNLCQRTLPVEDSDVVTTKKILRLHFDSEEHLYNVKYVSSNN